MPVPRPLAFRLVQMFDVGAWMKVYRETLHEHVHPHCFKFIKQNSKVVMFYSHCIYNERVTLMRRIPLIPRVWVSGV